MDLDPKSRCLLRATLLGACALTPLTSHALSAPREDVAAFIGTTLDAMAALNPSAALPGAGELTRGTAMRRRLTVAAGDTLSFDWFFGTDEGPNGAGNGIIDFAFFSIDGKLSLLASVLDPLERPAVNNPFNDQLRPQTPGADDYFRTTSVVFAASGEVLVGFAVVDVGDTVVESGLVIDNIALNGSLLENGGFEDHAISDGSASFPGWDRLGNVSVWDDVPPAPEGRVGALLMSGNFNPTPVPVPAAAWLFGCAVASLGWRRRRTSPAG